MWRPVACQFADVSQEHIASIFRYEYQDSQQDECETQYAALDCCAALWLTFCKTTRRHSRIYEYNPFPIMFISSKQMVLLQLWQFWTLSIVLSFI
jgi:hypothetical protein